MTKKNNLRVGLGIPIGKAKKRIRRIIETYLMEENGKLAVPVIYRRPPYIFGPPGIGKSALYKEIAEELGIGYVTFSLTHQVKSGMQGLPTISELNGEKITEFTIPDIIAEVLKAEQKGFSKGILLLDEFNCASEAIMPMMLEFLITRSIGAYTLPDGWIIVLCGNPPEYNRSARLFDAAIMDRVRKIDVIAEYEDFAEYAAENNIHPLICDYLKHNPSDLYYINNSNHSQKNDNKGASGTNYSHTEGQKRSEPEVVTPRGWESLSWTLKNYEDLGFEIDVDLIREFIKSDEIAADFYTFYQISTQLFDGKDMEKILKGKNLEEYASKAGSAKLAFKLSLIDLLVEVIESKQRQLNEKPDGKEAISEMISNAFRFVVLLPEKSLVDSLFARINRSAGLTEVLMNVKNEEYLNICKKAYCIDDENKTA